MKPIAGILATTLLAATTLFSGFAAAAPIDRDDAGRCHVSLFGTVENPRPGMFTLRASRQDYRYIHVFTTGARINANGLALQQGRFAGIYGCYSADGRSFRAEEVTLSTSSQTYREPVTLDAVISLIEPQMHRILLHTNIGYVWAYIAPGRYFKGEHVRVTGTFNPAESRFNATSIVRV
jgi:hypothetical protein